MDWWSRTWTILPSWASFCGWVRPRYHIFYIQNVLLCFHIRLFFFCFGMFRNNLWGAYTLPSTYPTVWNYIGLCLLLYNQRNLSLRMYKSWVCVCIILFKMIIHVFFTTIVEEVVIYLMLLKQTGFGTLTGASRVIQKQGESLTRMYSLLSSFSLP